MQIITPITIDLINPYPLLNFNLKQGDSGRGILVTVTANGANVEFTTETVNIYIKKPDGNIIYNACTVSGNQVRAMFTNQALAVAGKAQVELEIVSQDDTISTPIACIDIFPTNIDSEAIESSNEFTALTEALNKVAPSVEAANTAAGAANQAAKSANNAAQAANDITKEVETKLENGDFVGPPGPPGSIDNVTGAATSILTVNLDASKALVSDGSGKVAASDITATELGYLDGVTSGIQGQLNEKQAAVTGAASTITGNNLTASRALVSNGSGKVAASAVTATELGYLDGVTSGIQSQLNTLNSKSQNIAERFYVTMISTREHNTVKIKFNNTMRHFMLIFGSANQDPYLGIVDLKGIQEISDTGNVVSIQRDAEQSDLYIITCPTWSTFFVIGDVEYLKDADISYS